MNTMFTEKTPRGIFNIKAVFENEQEAKENGFYPYFTNDNGNHIFTKHKSEYSVYFAIVKKW